eukprot:1987582-Pyramimonas_sp.AAC.1
MRRRLQGQEEHVVSGRVLFSCGQRHAPGLAGARLGRHVVCSCGQRRAPVPAGARPGPLGTPSCGKRDLRGPAGVRNSVHGLCCARLAPGTRGLPGWTRRNREVSRLSAVEQSRASIRQ